MWDRVSLKERAKVSFRRNYWKCVLVSLILTVVSGGMSGGIPSFNFNSNDKHTDIHISNFSMEGWAILGIAALIFIIILFIIFLVVLALDIFLFNPLEVGAKRFFNLNLEQEVDVNEVTYSFKNYYKNIVKIMFLKDLFTFLWSLLLVIPGIIKGYEYMMIPYLLGENPEMTKDEAFAESKKMMDGQKWNAFVLDLSFIGWYLLTALTCGILGVFYVGPYVNAAHAALYDTLKYKDSVYEGNSEL